MKEKEDLFQTLAKDLVVEEHQFITYSSVVARQKLLEDLVKKALESSGKTLEQQDSLVKSKLRDRGLTFEEKQPSKQPKRSKPKKQRTGRKLRGSRLFAIPKEEQCFQAFVPLHWLWLEYARKVLTSLGIQTSAPSSSQVSLEWIYRMDFHGAIFTIVGSKTPQLVGSWGIVLQETSNVFKIIGPDDTLKVIPKQVCDFGCRIDDFCFILHGKAFRVKSSERSVKKLKRKQSE
ncbi:hypothetical protein GAYE_SCF00G1842 [Galdieria yellowstonensis]|uniref:Ribonuclease P protein subunit p29 n=1 Tax=Galdieria yellowstonensis TaxID=3028027 RepID=A0AAV9I967_9RHOD|nr:hypothetical protein GAYE_SCF00G1842 [Galdieria yellowstonensis]